MGSGLSVAFRRWWIAALVLAVFCGDAAVSLAGETVEILPARIRLTGPLPRQRVVAERVLAGKYLGQVGGEVAWTSSNPDVARYEDGFVIGGADGQATLSVRIGQATATAEVEVQGARAEPAWTFRNHVEAVLAKAGCNSGACHGALAGKGGFKLTLRGYDPEIDFNTITRQARGRRVDLADPGRSLLLAKPSGAIPHKGGVRFDVDSLDYQVLSQWIARGAAAPREDDRRIERLEVLPAAVSMEPGESQQLVVRAHFTGGHVEDVTHWVKYASADETVASVSDGGLVRVLAPGGGAITAWYASRIVLARVEVPYPNTVAPETFRTAPRRNFIDDHVLARLESLRLPPSPPCGDEEFLRRAFLDTIGLLPTADEARAFLADPAPDKRDQLIDALLARPEFVDYWAYKWSDVLLLTGQKLRPDAIKAYYAFIRQSVASNQPWDQFVRDVITARGSSVENGATNFYALHQDPQEMTENACQAFLGLSINCARCHNHPLEKWTNNQYYAMANLFARVRAKGWGGDFRNGDGKRTLYAAEEGELVQPLTGKPQPPTPLDGEPIPFDAVEDRRIHLARWMTAPENPYFTRAIANRVWANFFGTGLVERIDDLRASNPASNDELLAAAAQFLVERQYNLKDLMRAILQSASYQRSSHPLDANKGDTRFYSRYYPRRMMAEVLLDAISQATGVATEFKDYPAGTRSLQLPDANVQSTFLKTFGRPDRIITCECERSAEPSMLQVMHITNGDTVNLKLSSKEGRLEKLLAAGATDEQAVEEIYLAALTRLPTPEEKAQLSAVLSQVPAPERRAALEDVFWSVLSSREFLFNH